MAVFEVLADGAGETYLQNDTTGNGENDLVNVTITDGFGPGSTIIVLSASGDDELETINVTIPAGWTVVRDSIAANPSEVPSYKTANYSIFDDNGEERGTMTLEGNLLTGAAACFAGGTMIETPFGPKEIEDLGIGDLVVTRDRGPQPIRWINSKKMNATRLMISENLRPIRISAGALGDGLPTADLVVSPQHRILVRSTIAQEMFGAAEVLVAAKHLLSLQGIEIAMDLAEVEYFHMLFEQHEVVISNGAETESLYPGPQMRKAVGNAPAEELYALFPELRDLELSPTPARPLLKGRHCKELAQRHSVNDLRLVS